MAGSLEDKERERKKGEGAKQDGREGRMDREYQRSTSK